LLFATTLVTSDEFFPVKNEKSGWWVGWGRGLATLSLAVVVVVGGGGGVVGVVGVVVGGGGTSYIM
jgi:hypothetical protein